MISTADEAFALGTSVLLLLGCHTEGHGVNIHPAVQSNEIQMKG